MDTFYFLKFTQEKILNKDFLCVHVLDFEKDSIFKIYKLYSEENHSALIRFDRFESITDSINFTIKTDKSGKAKICLDINLK